MRPDCLALVLSHNADFSGCRRRKLQHDPNNTHWSKSINRFGQRILQAQGWTPGNTLGAIDSSNLRHHSAASKSHVRVTINEGNQGLGAHQEANQAREMEHHVLSGIFDRLGAGDGVSGETSERQRVEHKPLPLICRKYGFMPFVRGETLIGDDNERASAEPLSENEHRRREVSTATVPDPKKEPKNHTQAKGQNSERIARNTWEHNKATSKNRTHARANPPSLSPEPKVEQVQNGLFSSDKPKVRKDKGDSQLKKKGRHKAIAKHDSIDQTSRSRTALDDNDEDALHVPSTASDELSPLRSRSTESTHRRGKEERRARRTARKAEKQTSGLESAIEAGTMTQLSHASEKPGSKTRTTQTSTPQKRDVAVKLRRKQAIDAKSMQEVSRILYLRIMFTPKLTSLKILMIPR